MEHINEEINRISELMRINEAPPRKKVVSTAAKEKVAMNAAQARQASLEKSAKKKKAGTTTSKIDDVTQSAKPISKKKKIVLDDPEIKKSLEDVLGPKLSQKARKQFEGMSDETILKYLQSIESGKFSRLPEVIQEKINLILKKDPTWLERWSKRIKNMPVKYQAIFWGSVLFGGTYVLGVISERGPSGLIDIMTKPFKIIYGFAKKGSESDWKSYVKDLNNYKVEDENGVLIGTLKDVLKPNETIVNPIYTKIQNKVDTWVDENDENYTPTTMKTAMDDVLNYIISDIDTEFNSKYYVSPMLENDPSRPTLKNKSKDYWEKLKTSVSNAKQNLK
jgi:hypothetical protein